MKVLVLSDIHANLVALESVLNAASRQYDALWCLGDIVGYGPRPNECIELIRDQATICVMGNHDWAALDRSGLAIDEFVPHAQQAVLWTRAQLTSKSRTFLDQLSDQPLHPLPSDDILLTHASPREPVWEYVTTPSIALENFELFREKICLFGHTHKPVVFRWSGSGKESKSTRVAGVRLPKMTDFFKTRPTTVNYIKFQVDEILRLKISEQQRFMLNPGSVGQPRDGDARASYAFLDTSNMTWQYKRVAYPVELTQNEMRNAGLPKRLIDRLSLGW